MAGCSVDDLPEQQAFAGKHDLRFPLIADPDAVIARAYGAYRDDWKVAARATAVIDEDGTVLKAYPKVDIKGAGHAEEVLTYLRTFLG